MRNSNDSNTSIPPNQNASHDISVSVIVNNPQDREEEKKRHQERRGAAYAIEDDTPQLEFDESRNSVRSKSSMAMNIFKKKSTKSTNLKKTTSKTKKTSKAV